MDNIESWSLLKTNNGNKYLYNRKMKHFQLCHPLLFYMLELSKIVDLRNWFNDLRKRADDYVEIENCGRFLKKEIDYYFRKFLLLKESGYFSEIDQKERLCWEIDAETIKNSLSNLKHVIFEVTERCNFSCSYCGYGKFYYNHDKRENKNLDVPTAKRLLQYLAQLWNSPLNKSHNQNIRISFYGGEPLLNFPFIFEVVDYVKQLNIPRNRFIFSMTTNGVMIEKYMDFLHENDFELLISLDGNEQNNAYRVFKNGKPTYKTIMMNVKAMQVKYPDYFLNRVNFNAVLHNKNSVSDIYHFFKKHFDKTPYIAPLNTSGVKESQKKEFWQTYSNLEQSLHESEDYSVIEKDMLIKLPNIEDVKRFLYNFNDFCFKNYNDLIYSSSGNKRLPTGTCLPFSLKIFLTVKGKILPCERIDHKFDLGYVTPQKVELDCEKVAEKYNNYYNRMRTQCSVCRNVEFCGQCMFNIDAIDDKNPVCNGFMTETDYAKNVSSYLNYIEDQPGSYSRMLKEAES